LNKLQENISIASELDIFTQGFFMLGFPTETEQDAQMTIDFACRSKLTFASFFIVKPTRGTELWEMACERSEEAAVHQGGLDYHSFHPNLSAMSDAALRQVYREANRRFYRSLRRLLDMHRMIFSGPKSLTLLRFYGDNLGLFLKRLLRFR